jgi:hypothetical protein
LSVGGGSDIYTRSDIDYPLPTLRPKFSHKPLMF